MQAHVLEQALGSWRGLDLAYAAALSQAHLHACSCFVTASGLTSDTLLFSRLNALALLVLLLLLTLLTLLLLQPAHSNFSRLSTLSQYRSECAYEEFCLEVHAALE